MLNFHIFWQQKFFVINDPIENCFNLTKKCHQFYVKQIIGKFLEIERKFPLFEAIAIIFEN
jgi:hypothetical protein